MKDNPADSEQPDGGRNEVWASPAAVPEQQTGPAGKAPSFVARAATFVRNVVFELDPFAEVRVCPTAGRDQEAARCAL